MIAYSFSPEILKEDENAILNSSLFTHWLKKIETNFIVKAILTHFMMLFEKKLFLT